MFKKQTHNRHSIKPQGQMIIEIIVAIGIFMIIIAGVVPFYLSTYKSSLKDTNNLQADLYLQQGLEAARSMRDYSFGSLVNGVHGLSRATGYWLFSGTSDTFDKFTRIVTVSDVNRDGNCNIVANGGTIDANSKQVTVTINWNYVSGDPGQLTSTEYLTNWRYQSGCEQSGDLQIDLSNASLSSDEKRVWNIYIRNIGSSPIVIDKILPIWTNSEQIEEIKIGSTIVWKYNNTGSPSGKQPSGVELNIQNYTLPANSGWIQLDHFKFGGGMEEAIFTIYFTMIDGTVRYQRIQLPDD